MTAGLTARRDAVLVPALRVRLRDEPAMPHWIKWMRKVVTEECHQLPQLVHVLQLLSRHGDVFYAYRSLVSDLRRGRVAADS